jgi:hypothetical protein
VSVGDLTPSEIRELALDPVLWVKSVLNATPDDWQGDVLSSYVNHSLTAVRSATGVGKGALLSFIDLHYLHVGYLVPWLTDRPGASDVQPKLILTSTDEKQLLTALWPEHKLWLDNSNGLDEIFEWQATTIRHRHKDFRDTWAAYAITSALRKSRDGSSHAGGSQGQHRANQMISLDEAAHIEEPYWAAFLGTLSQAWNRLFAFGNPDMLSGMFYRIWHDKSVRELWQRYTIAARDNARSRAAASLGDKYFVSERAAEGPNHDILIKTWGMNHPIVQTKVGGIHPTASLPNTAYAWEEFQKARIPGRIVPTDADTKQIGCDVARFGDNQTVYTIRNGRRFRQEKERKQSIDHIIDRLMSLIEAEVDPTSDEEELIVAIDETGVGGGVVDGAKRKCRERGWKARVFGVAFGGAPRQPEKYVNIAAEMWLEDAKGYFSCLHCGQYYEAHLDDAPAPGSDSAQCVAYDPSCEVPDDDDMMNSAISRTYRIVESRPAESLKQTDRKNRKIERRAIQSKDEMDVSPDEMDSFCLSCVRPPKTAWIA